MTPPDWSLTTAVGQLGIMLIEDAGFVYCGCGWCRELKGDPETECYVVDRDWLIQPFGEGEWVVHDAADEIRENAVTFREGEWS